MTQINALWVPATQKHILLKNAPTEKFSMTRVMSDLADMTRKCLYLVSLLDIKTSMLRLSSRTLYPSTSQLLYSADMYRIHKWMKPTRRALITFLPPLNNKRLALDIRWTPRDELPRLCRRCFEIWLAIGGGGAHSMLSPLVKFIVRVSRIEKELVIN